MMTFQEAAIKSAQLYYDYLKEHDEGVIKYRVKRIVQDNNAIKQNEYWLELYNKPKYIDCLEISINENKYSHEQIKPSVFDSYRCMLKVILSSGVIGVFDQCNPTSVVVFSDLKFLVRRILMWYKDSRNTIRLPDGNRIVEPVNESIFELQASYNQIEAIKGALSNPLSYIWGAPGTGKTQFVLSRAVLAYVKNNNRVLIVAPTNNAVEQTLNGVIPVLKQAGFDVNTLLIRIGTASSDFATKYPGVCEDTGYSSAISEINDNIISVQNDLEEIKRKKQLFQEYQIQQAVLTDFLENKEKIEPLLSLLIDVGDEITRLNSTIKESDLLISSLLDKAQQNKDSEEFYNRQANDFIKKTKRSFFFLLSQSKKETIKRSADTALEKARYYEKRNAEIESELDINRNHNRELQDDLHDRQKIFNDTVSEISNGLGFSKASQVIAREIDNNNYTYQAQRIRSTINEEIEELNNKSALYSAVAGRTNDYFVYENRRLLEQLNEYKERKQKLEATTTSKQIGDCLVVACTIDACLNRIPTSKENFFDHVFLDEAGYCSLIKAATLTAYSNRLTLLGDHMQLPPVCVADDEEIEKGKNLLISLWAQSAIFLESIFNKSPEQICYDYLEKEPESFYYMERFDLLNSYRFGQELADVLAEDVYNKDFCGNAERSTKIYYIDAPRQQEKIKRTSTSECEAIKKVLEYHRVLKRTSGIIAPYKNQVKILGDMAKAISFPEESVVTIHQSQGREWNNVFLSVTDTANKWFTDSLKLESNGKKVINTAVSRAKKRLIIVCDYNYWVKQETQLIGKLLSVAEELNV